MKPLTVPDVDDDIVLRGLAQNADLASYPDLLRLLHRMVRRYRRYVSARGNPWTVGNFRRPPMSEVLKTALQKHYEVPPDVVNYLDNIRRRGSPDVCPMCGSLGTGTLDHVFPKTTYPEFAVFSRNLVPACFYCNLKRSQSLKGSKRGQRILHPYFDQELRRRLVRARFSAADGSFAKPIIEVEICIPKTDPVYTAVSYHVDNVVKKTMVVEYLEKRWVTMRRTPEAFLTLPAGAISNSDLLVAVKQQLANLDRQRATRNNWDSMLFAGLAVNRNARAFLRSSIEEMRSGRLKAEDI